MEIKNTSVDFGIGPDELKLVSFSKYNEQEYSRIISAISHDISNPIAILKSNIQLLTGNGGKNNKEFTDQLLEMCNESIEELVCFLEDIRLINTSIRYKIIPKFSNFVLKDVFADSFFYGESRNFNQKRIIIQTNIESYEFSSDLEFLHRILSSLVNNALKFSNDDVLIGISFVQSNLEIIVRDFGIGIPEDETETIFNPFFRGSNIKKTPGMGLGLSIVKALTESLGGQIYLYSLINHGTIFRIVIPNETAN